jgi:hypothetical protein
VTEAETFRPDRWLLTVNLEHPDEQYRRDGELVFPQDEASQLVAFICEAWRILPEEIPECVRWREDVVQATCGSLDHLQEVLQWLTFHAVPYRFEVSRAYAESDLRWPPPE